MRRRITVAILGVVIGTLVLTVVGSLLLVWRAGISTAENELTTEAQAIGGLMSSYPVFTDTKVVGVLRRVGAFDHLTLVGLSPTGSVQGVPAPVVSRLLNIAALRSGDAVAGNVGHVVFVAQPLGLSLTQRQALHDGLPPSDARVLVVTRHVANPVNGVDYFVLVAAVVLLAGVAVAAVLARRISAPIERAVGATRQMASGSLEATLPVDRHEYPELADLATAINTLGENLSRAQGLEREFLLSVSHELRTPLTSIRGYADAIADGATDDVPGALSIIGSEARRLERLVQDLLDLARLQARQFSLHTQRIDCAAVARTVAEGFQPEAASVGVELVAPTTQRESLWADADPDRVGQVIANLIENALKFATARVEVGAHGVGDWIALWVSDDGPGVSSADLPHIFERHYSSDRVQGRKAGVGLGLTIVAELASAMDAVVDAQSPVDNEQGARMVLWMHRRPSPDQAEHELPTDETPSDGPTPALPLYPPE
jgi:two-component system sensor histidine kinase BaeS